MKIVLIILTCIILYNELKGFYYNGATQGLVDTTKITFMDYCYIAWFGINLLWNNTFITWLCTIFLLFVMLKWANWFLYLVRIALITLIVLWKIF